jgi:hypothetical protein
MQLKPPVKDDNMLAIAPISRLEQSGSRYLSKASFIVVKDIIGTTV